MTSVDIDRSLIDAYRTALSDVASAEVVAKAIRTVIETMLGDNEIGVVDGEPAIRWSHTTTRRLDMERLRELVDPAVLAECYVEVPGRQFRVVKAKESAA